MIVNATLYLEAAYELCSPAKLGDSRRVLETRIQALAHPRGHEITSFGGAKVEHDIKGNRTFDQHGRSFTWDFDNRLQSANVPDDSPEGEPGDHQYTYDAMGRRVSKTTGGELTIFVCSGSQVVCEYQVDAGVALDPLSPNQRYVYGSYVDEVILKDGEFTDDTASGIVFYHRNQQYSIIALTDLEGEVVERYAYTAYGQMTVLDELGVERDSGKTDFANPYTYTARRFDEELGLMYFRARYYDPTTGEFISRDPLGYVDGMSQYRAYFVPGAMDPSGEAITKAQCEAAVAKAEKEAKSKNIIDALVKNPNCKKPKIICASCKVGGNFDRGKNLIKICYDNLDTTVKHVSGIVHHELVHAFDVCNGADLSSPGFAKGNCNHNICSEIRAYSIANCNDPKSLWRTVKQGNPISREDCILSGVYRSTIVTKPCYSIYLDIWEDVGRNGTKAVEKYKNDHIKPLIKKCGLTDAQCKEKLPPKFPLVPAPAPAPAIP